MTTASQLLVESPADDVELFPGKDIVYFDLETQRTADDVGGWDKKCDMGMSVGVIYSTAQKAYEIYGEDRAADLIERLRRADLVVGYNHINFDLEVLNGYTVFDVKNQCLSLDLMVEIEGHLQSRLPLEAVAQGCLGVGKIAHGLDAIKWWRQGKLMDIAEYCCFDVKVTKLVHEFGAVHKCLYYIDRFGNRQKIEMEWGEITAVA